MIDFKKIVAPYKDEMIANLKDFCAIPSVFDKNTADENNPFGTNVTKALNFISDIAKKDGFIVNNYNNKVVEILYGHGDKNITILAHADVVPEGEGWDQDPYKVKQVGDELIGRGTADDKGPCLSCYYGLKALKDNNLLGDYQVRFLVGGNEESGSKCMVHYFDELKKPIPTLGFTPDSSFPVGFAEKGMLFHRVFADLNVSGLISLNGGIVANAVISRCKVVFKKDENFISFIKENYPNTEIKINDDSVEFTFIGKAAHGSIPHEGFNAGLEAIKALYEYTKIPELNRFYSFYINPYGRGLNAYSYSDDMGVNSTNLGIVNYQDGKWTFVVDFRYVQTANVEQLKKNIIQTVSPYKVVFDSEGGLLYFPKDSTLISTLFKAYKEESGDNVNGPYSTGGGTYAKHTSNVVAFGLEFPGVDSKMHAPGEHISISHLVLGMQIYARAIYELGKKLNEN